MKKLFFFVLIIVNISFINAALVIGESNEDRGVIIQIQEVIVSTFLDLIDSPSSYSGEGGQCVKVNIGETGLEFGDCGNGTGGGGFETDQNEELNTTGNPTFNNLTLTGNLTVEGDLINGVNISNVSEGVHTTDTNCSASNSCGNILYSNNISDINVSDLNNNLNWINQSQANTSGDDRWLQLNGANANQNVNIDDFNFSTTGSLIASFLGDAASFLQEAWITTLNTGTINSDDWSNVSITSQQVSNFNDTVNELVSNFTLGAIVGETSTSFDGNLSNGTDIGYVAGNAICAAEFSGGHFCSAAEVMRAIGNDQFNFSGTNWIQNGPPGFTANADDCAGWTDNDNTFLGPFWNWDFNAQAGAARLTNCAQSKALLCCGG